ncbi:hematopoietic SH2 domain-containing protein-like [Hyla sarda]|uniref:hematopoietic SH2 domain-containing protein-like n=1 Tax=Hyla sarda TaxID=327740 RepID=UPI0024C3B28C|nr:hematopoietic SH2 domain-containing protein-like [Hyla sarda]XP_056407968.1 hematopoietic SH2 domain-containing protein-like [Hyla sarda]
MEENKPSVQWFIDTQSEWFLQHGIPEWFHGIITRKDAEDLLKDTAIGCFLIRVSESRIGYSLSYRTLDRFRHFMIDVLKDQQCILAGDTIIHNTLEDLVNFHKQHPLCPYHEFLTQPCGQKTSSGADYEELFENRSTTQTSFHSPEHSPIGISMLPTLPVETHNPPVPPRRLQTSYSFNSQIMTPACNPTSVNRLYPLLPTELQKTGNTVPLIPSEHRPITKSQSVDLPHPNTAHSSNWPSKNERLGNSSKKPLKACKSAMNKAVSFMKEGDIAQDLKKMENTMAAHMKNVKDSFGRFGQTGQKNSSPTLQKRSRQPSVPEEYTAPPPFAPGFS